MALGMEVGLGPGHIVLDGHFAALAKKGAEPPIFDPSLCGQTAGWIKMPLCTEVGLSPNDIVLHGDPAPPKEKGTAPQFSAHVYCGQTAVCIRITLCREVGGPQPRRHCVRWGPNSSSPKGAQPPLFGQCALWPNGWMD